MADETVKDVALVNEQAAETARGMMSLIKEALTNPAITPEKLNGLLDFKERLDRKNAETEANAAFARVVKSMPAIKKNGMIDFSSEKKGKQKPIPYAKFEDIQEAIRPIYEAEDFVLTFDSEPLDSGWAKWSAILTHANGHVRRASISLPLDTSGGKQNVQGAGSTSQYGKRYATGALFNLVFEGADDDGVRGGMKFITDAQVSEINSLIEETGTNKDKFLQSLSLATVSNIEQGELAMVLNLLKNKKRAQEARKYD